MWKRPRNPEGRGTGWRTWAGDVSAGPPVAPHEAASARRPLVSEDVPAPRRAAARPWDAGVVSASVAGLRRRTSVPRRRVKSHPHPVARVVLAGAASMCAHVWGRERVRPHSGAVPSTRRSAGCGVPASLPAGPAVSPRVRGSRRGADPRTARPNGSGQLTKIHVAVAVRSCPRAVQGQPHT